MATKVNLFVDQGATFSTTVDFVDAANAVIDFSTYTGAGQIRKHYTSNTAVELGINLANTGVVTLSLTANQTANMTAGRYVYDVEVIDVANVTSRIIEGIVTVNPNVTRT